MSRIIHTNLYSDKAYDLINDIVKIGKYYHSGKIYRSLNTLSIEREPDSEITLKIDNNSWYYARNIFCQRETDAKALEWIAWLIKDSIYRSFNARHLDPSVYWNRLNFNNFCEFNNIKINVVDAYFIYDTFKNRKNINKRYDATQIATIRGKQKDPVATELEIARRIEILKIEEKYKTIGDNIRQEAYSRRRQAESEINDWKESQIAKMNDDKNKEIEELNKMAGMVIG